MNNDEKFESQINGQIRSKLQELIIIIDEESDSINKITFLASATSILMTVLIQMFEEKDRNTIMANICDVAVNGSYQIEELKRCSKIEDK